MKSDFHSKITAKFQTEFNAIIVYGLRIAGALLTFILQIFLARWMGKYEYGLFALVWSCIIIGGELLSFGFYNLIQRLLPEYRIKNQMSLLRGALFGAAGTIILTSIASSLFIALLLYGLNASGHLDQLYLYPLLIGITALPAFALSDYFSGVGRSYGWMIRAFSPSSLFRPLAIIGLVAGLVAFGFNATAITATLAATIAVWTTLLLSYFVIGKKIPEAEYSGPRQYNLRPWILAALPMMMVSSLEILLFNLDVLMISLFLEPDQTGIYFAATKIMALVSFLNFAIGSAFTRHYAEFHAANDHNAQTKIIRRSASLTFYPSLIMLIVILVLNKPLLSLFGDGFTSAAIVIFPLAIGLMLRALVGPGERILMMTGQQHICAIIYVGTVFLDLGLNYMLIPLYGIKGAAIATSISFSFMAIMLLILIKSRLNIISLPFLPAQLVR